MALLYVGIGPLPLPLLELGAGAEAEWDSEELEEASALAGDPEAALGLPLVG